MLLISLNFFNFVDLFGCEEIIFSGGGDGRETESWDSEWERKSATVICRTFERRNQLKGGERGRYPNWEFVRRFERLDAYAERICCEN